MAKAAAFFWSISDVSGVDSLIPCQQKTKVLGHSTGNMIRISALLVQYHWKLLVNLLVQLQVGLVELAQAQAQVLELEVGEEATLMVLQLLIFCCTLWPVQPKNIEMEIKRP